MQLPCFGLIGGTSWHATALYYRLINQAVNNHFGNNTNPPLSVYTLNQAAIHRFQENNQWYKIENLLVDAGKRLIKAGADGLAFCANTPHKCFDSVQAKLEVRLLHIADATAQTLQKQRIHKAAFIGTRFSMTEAFMQQRYGAHDIELICPTELATIHKLHQIITQSLSMGHTKPHEKEFVIDVVQSLISKGARAVVLGCTEFSLLVSAKDFSIPVMDTTALHAQAISQWILQHDL